jgi:hypothetical protein
MSAVVYNVFHDEPVTVVMNNYHSTVGISCDSHWLRPLAFQKKEKDTYVNVKNKVNLSVEALQSMHCEL